MAGTWEPHDTAARSADRDPAGRVVAAGTEPFTFPAVARLELDDLLGQLIDRATEVLRVQGRLQGLVRATQAIATDLDLPSILQRVVDEARGLIGARYAALAVIGEDRTLAQFVHSGRDHDLVDRIGGLPTGRGLLGQLSTDQQPLRLRLLSEHGSSVGFPPGHPAMRSLLGVPVRIRGQVFGNLYLTEKIDGETFSSEDEELALSLAAAAGAAIDNARLFESLGHREHWLHASRSVTNALLETGDHDQALHLVTRSLRAAAAADYAAVIAPDSTGRLIVAAADGTNAARSVGCAVPPKSPSTRAIHDRAPVVLDDLSAHDDLIGRSKTSASARSPWCPSRRATRFSVRWPSGTCPAADRSAHATWRWLRTSRPRPRSYSLLRRPKRQPRTSR